MEVLQQSLPLPETQAVGQTEVKLSLSSLSGAEDRLILQGDLSWQVQSSASSQEGSKKKPKKSGKSKNEQR